MPGGVLNPESTWGRLAGAGAMWLYSRRWDANESQETIVAFPSTVSDTGQVTSPAAVFSAGDVIEAQYSERTGRKPRHLPLTADSHDRLRAERAPAALPALPAPIVVSKQRPRPRQRNRASVWANNASVAAPAPARRHDTHRCRPGRRWGLRRPRQASSFPESDGRRDMAGVTEVTALRLRTWATLFRH